MTYTRARKDEAGSRNIAAGAKQEAAGEKLKPAVQQLLAATGLSRPYHFAHTDR